MEISPDTHSDSERSVRSILIIYLNTNDPAEKSRKSVVYVNIEPLISQKYRETITFLEEHLGPYPYWTIADTGGDIPSSVRRLYILLDANLFIIALKRSPEMDIPIYFNITHQSNSLISVIKASLPILEWEVRPLDDEPTKKTIYLDYAACIDHQRFPTTPFIILDMSNPDAYELQRSTLDTIPLSLQMSFMDCEDLVESCCRLSKFPHQALHLTYSLHHLLYALAEVFAQTAESNEDELSNSLRMQELIDEMAIIVQELEAQTLNFTGYQDRLIQYMKRLCGDLPGAVSIRYSYSLFERLGKLDRQNDVYSGKHMCVLNFMHPSIVFSNPSTIELHLQLPEDPFHPIPNPGSQSISMPRYAMEMETTLQSMTIKEETGISISHGGLPTHTIGEGDELAREQRDYRKLKALEKERRHEERGSVIEEGLRVNRKQSLNDTKLRSGKSFPPPDTTSVFTTNSGDDGKGWRMAESPFSDLLTSSQSESGLGHKHRRAFSQNTSPSFLSMQKPSDASYTQPQQSPRTTRLKMLASEVPDDLRRDLLWERQVNRMGETSSPPAVKPLEGIIYGFGRPVIRHQDLPAPTPLPDAILMETEPSPPFFIVSHTWKALLKYIANQSQCRIEPSPAVLAREKKGIPNLRAVMHFVKLPTLANEWRIILYFAVEPITPPPENYPVDDTSVVPYLFPPPEPGRPLAHTPETQIYTITTLPLPVLPLSVPHLALYLQAALEESQRSSGSKGRLAKLVNSTIQTEMKKKLSANPGSTVGDSDIGKGREGNWGVRANESLGPNRGNIFSRLFRPKGSSSKGKGLGEEYEGYVPWTGDYQ